MTNGSRAARLHGPGDIRLHDEARPAPVGPHERLVAVTSVGLCGSDLHWFIADRGLKPAKQETYATGVRKATFVDPDGNEIGFGGGPDVSHVTGCRAVSSS